MTDEEIDWMDELDARESYSDCEACARDLGTPCIWAAAMYPQPADKTCPIDGTTYTDRCPACEAAS